MARCKPRSKRGHRPAVALRRLVQLLDGRAARLAMRRRVIFEMEFNLGKIGKVPAQLLEKEAARVLQRRLLLDVYNLGRRRGAHRGAEERAPDVGDYGEVGKVDGRGVGVWAFDGVLKGFRGGDGGAPLVEPVKEGLCGGNGLREVFGEALTGS